MSFCLLMGRELYTLEVLLHGVGWGVNNYLDGNLIKVTQPLFLQCILFLVLLRRGPTVSFMLMTRLTNL